MRAYLRPNVVLLVGGIAALLQLSVFATALVRPDRFAALNGVHTVLWVGLFAGSIVYLSRQAERGWLALTVLNVWLAWIVAQLLVTLVVRFGLRLIDGPAATEIASVDTYFVVAADPLTLAGPAVVWALPVIALLAATLGALTRRVFPPTAAEQAHAAGGPWRARVPVPASFRLAAVVTLICAERALAARN